MMPPDQPYHHHSSSSSLHSGQQHGAGGGPQHGDYRQQQPQQQHSMHGKYDVITQNVCWEPIHTCPQYKVKKKKRKKENCCVTLKWNFRKVGSVSLIDWLIDWLILLKYPKYQIWVLFPPFSHEPLNLNKIGRFPDLNCLLLIFHYGHSLRATHFFFLGPTAFNRHENFLDFKEIHANLLSRFKHFCFCSVQFRAAFAYIHSLLRIFSLSSFQETFWSSSFFLLLWKPHSQACFLQIL